MAISQNFSTIRPSLSLDFTKSKRLDSRLTFTRTSSATFIDEDGYIKLAPAGIPRFDHNHLTGECNGILIEEPRTNLCRRSEEFNDTTFWTRPDFNLVTVTPNAILSPDGTVDADLAVNVGGGVSLLQQSITVPASSTTDYYVSIYAKRGTATYFTFNCYYTGNTEHNVDFNFDTGVVNGAPNSDFFMQNVGNGWYRCGFRMNRDATGTRTELLFRMWHSGRGQTSGNTYFWGAQLEVGTFPTSYIPTTTASVTRNAENMSITGNNFTNWYNPLEGTINIAYRLGLKTAATRIFQINNSTTGGNNVLDMITGSGIGSGGYFFINRNNVQEGSVPDSTPNASHVNTVFKVCAGYKTNDMAGINSKDRILGTDTSVTIPTGMDRVVFAQNDFGSLLCGHLQYVQYYPNRLSNTQIQTLIN